MSNIIDFSVIDGLKEIGDQEFLEELVNIFLSQSEDIMKDIISSTEEKNAQAINKAAHKLKGSCLNLGAQPMSELCQKIESSSQQNDLSDIDTNVNELKRLHKETCAELKKLI